jgi:hypothetical protein
VHVCLVDNLSNSDVGNYITFAKWTHVRHGVSVLLGLWSLPSVTRSHSLAFKLGHTVRVKLMCALISQKV